MALEPISTQYEPEAEPRVGVQLSAPLSAKQALDRAWISWGVLLIFPLLWATLAWVAQGEGGAPAIGWGLSMTAGVWLIVMGPAIYLLRGFCFRAGWVGRKVEPNSYLRGLIEVWLVFETAAVLALVGCMLGGDVWPGLAIVFLSALLIGALYPDERAVADVPRLG